VKTPGGILAALKAAVVKAAAAPDLCQRFADQGVEPRAVTGAGFDKYYVSEVARWGKVVREVGIKPE
jgi:tripartite-type tricarboxylate transporter receptor subunit TctC